MEANFGERLKDLRKDRGLTVRELARKSEVSQSYITNVENGKKPVPEAKILKKLAKPLGLTDYSIFTMAGYLKREKQATPASTSELTFNIYQKATRRTGSTDHPAANRIFNYALGIAGEAGEVADLIKKHHFHGHSMSQLDVEKELGDLLWYISRLADEYGIPLSSIASVNLSKLLERYPQGFSSADSIKRVDVNG